MIDPSTLAPGAIVRHDRPGSNRYQFLRRGCATGMEPCQNGEWNITVVRFVGGEPRGMTQCLNSMEVVPA